MPTLTTTHETEAIEALREQLRPGDTVYTILRHVSASRMTRHISVVIMRENEPVDITWRVAGALGLRRDDRDD